MLRFDLPSIANVERFPLPPAAATLSGTDLRLFQRHVNVIALYFHVMFGDGLYRREGERLPGSYVELRSVAGALDLLADQLTLVQRPRVVGTDVLDSV